MKRVSKYVVAILLLISGCQSLYNLTIRPAVDLYFIHFFNSIFIIADAKYITCYYYEESKFPESYSDILPLLSDDPNDDFKLKDSKFLIRDHNFTGIAKYNFKLKNFKIGQSIADTTDSYFDSIKVYDCNGILTFTDSILYKDEKAFVIEVLITDIIGTLYWNGDSSYYDKFNSSQLLISSQDNYSIIKDTIQISKSCQKGYGFEINTKQQ